MAAGQGHGVRASCCLAGCILVFRKRAGIVLLHGGIALIMLSELFTAVAAVESQMDIAEGGNGQLFVRYPHDRTGRDRSLAGRPRSA